MFRALTGVGIMALLVLGFGALLGGVVADTCRRARPGVTWDPGPLEPGEEECEAGPW